MNKQLQIQQHPSHLAFKNNSCPKFSHCSAGFCPQTQQGLHVEGDPVCSRLPTSFTKEFAKDFKGASPAEVMNVVTKVFDKHNRKAD